MQKLSGLRFPVQETTVTKQTRKVIEARQIDTNPYFRDLQEYTEWCQNKLKELLAADYGSDLPSVKAELERHQQEHRVIDKFHSKVVQAERQQVNFSGDELNLYQQRLSQLQKVFAELLSTSTKRLSDLDALQNFLQAASAELQWLNDREQVEIQRDWAAKDLDVSGIHRYYEVSFESLVICVEWKKEKKTHTRDDPPTALLRMKSVQGHCKCESQTIIKTKIILFEFQA